MLGILHDFKQHVISGKAADLYVHLANNSLEMNLSIKDHLESSSR